MVVLFVCGNGVSQLGGGRVVMYAGPWRTSGHWWERQSTGRGQHSVVSDQHSTSAPSSPFWDRDEWEVALTDGGVYRIYRDRRQSRWFVDGVVD